MTLEQVAVALLAAADEVSIAQAQRLLDLGKDAKHGGDCTKQPWTCPACFRSNCIDVATRAVARLSEVGLRIVDAD